MECEFQFARNDLTAAGQNLYRYLIWVGKTFKYTAKDPEGLLKTARCLHIHAYGGFHSNDPRNHVDSFLREVFKFIGVEDFRSLIVEGHYAVPDRAETIIMEAYAQIPALVEWFAKGNFKQSEKLKLI